MVARFSHGISLLLASGLMVSGCSLLANPGNSTDASKAIGTVETTETPEVSEVNPSGAESEASSGASEDKEAQADSEAPASAQKDFFREATDRAQSAVSIGQSAQSPDDWKLVESRWKQAVLLMQQVPDSDPNHTVAQQKVSEYQQNASQAARKAQGPSAPSSTGTTAVASRPDGLVASIPIMDRLGGIPVVSVTLTGNQGTEPFQMLFDTGANLTLITPTMADQVGVVVVDEVVVTVADGRQVRLPVGYVDTLKVGELAIRDILVGIGGDVGLLGQDVYGQYGISAGGNSIKLYE